MMRRLLSLLCLATLIGCSSGPHGQGDESPSTGVAGRSADGAYRIAVIPKGTSHVFWQCVHAGAVQAEKELGNVEVVWKGPAQESDTAGQIELVKNMITQGVDAICLAPNHSEALIDVVEEASLEGIPVVIFDSGLGEGPEIVSYVATDNFAGGRMAADRLAEVMGGQGKAILMRYQAGSESTGQREDGFLDRIKDYPDIELISSDQYGGDTIQSSMEKTASLLTKYGDEVDGFFGVCEISCNGALEAIEQAGLAGKVKFVAFDPSESLIQGMEQDKVDGIVLQDPTKIGYTAVKTAAARLSGEVDIESRIQTGVYVATPENMHTEEYDRLLHPPIVE